MADFGFVHLVVAVVLGDVEGASHRLGQSIVVLFCDGWKFRVVEVEGVSKRDCFGSVVVDGCSVELSGLPWYWLVSLFVVED